MENYFKQHKILLGIFFLFFVIFAVYSVYSWRGIFNDGPNLYFYALNSVIGLGENPFNLFVQPCDIFPRMFGSIVLQLIYILLFPFFSGNIQSNFGLWTFSIVTMPFICLIFNYLVAHRTKRYDIAAFALAFYCLFSIPYFYCMTNELLVASMLQFIFLQYFVTNEKLTMRDYIIVALLLIFMFKSYENVVVLGVLFYIFSVIFALKRREKSIFYIHTGLLLLFAGVYVLYRDAHILYLSDYKDFVKACYDSIFPWALFLKQIPDATFNSSMIISFAGLFILINKIITKTGFMKKDLFLIISVLILSLLSIYNFTRFIPKPDTEINLFLYSVIALPIIFIIILIFECREKQFSQQFISNLIIVSCVVGIMQFGWQILSSYNCKQYTDTLKTVISTSDKPFSHIHFEYDTPGQPFDRSNYDNMFRSILLSEDKNIPTIIISDPEHINYRKDANFEFQNTYYNKDENTIYINKVPFNINYRFWNLDKIRDGFETANILNPTGIDSEFLDKLYENDLLYEFNPKEQMQEI